MVCSTNENNNPLENNQSAGNSNAPEYKSAIQILIDIIGNSSFLTFIISLILAILLSVLWDNTNYCEAQALTLCADILSAYSCIIGLVITGFSIILMLNRDTINELSKKYKRPTNKLSFLLNTKSSLYDILCSSFSLTFILLLVTITAILLYKNQPSIASAPSWQFFVIRVLSIMSAIYVIDLLFHLYEVCTFVSKNHREINILKKNKI